MATEKDIARIKAGLDEIKQALHGDPVPNLPPA